MNVAATRVDLTPPAPAPNQAGQGAPSPQNLSKLFDRIDVAGAGVITRPQFEAAVRTLNPSAPIQAASTDGLYAKLDPGGSGSVSKQGFVSILTGLLGGLRRPPEPALEPDTINQRLAAVAEQARAGSKLDVKI